MSKLISLPTIKKYPGTVMDTIGISDTIMIAKIGKEFNLAPVDSTSEYGKFYDEYINNGCRLEDIPEITGIAESTISAWASDLIGTLFNHCGEPADESDHNDHDDTETSSKKDWFYEGTSPVYERAKEIDADIYDFETGRIYHIQEYNRARKFGLPSQGIRVSVDGHTIGYAE